MGLAYTPNSFLSLAGPNASRWTPIYMGLWHFAVMFGVTFFISTRLRHFTSAEHEDIRELDEMAALEEENQQQV